MRLRRSCCLGICLLLTLAGCGGGERLDRLPADATILAFGDSLTFGTGVSAGASYPSVLADLTGLEVIRSGVPGEVSGRGVERLREVLETTDPDLVILCHGGNDVLRRMSLSAAERNVRQMVELARDDGAQVILVAVPKIGLFPSALDFFETIGAELDVPVESDVVSELLSDPAMKSDQVHFNGAGYRRMAEAIVDLFEREGAL